MLEEVKKRLGITGNYQDELIQGYIDEVIEFLVDGGVDETIAKSNSAIGIVTRGVSDLWNYGSGEAEFSPYFIQRAIQLCGKEDSESDEDE